MSVLEILILALVQGLTEFLPISSSGHLILVPLLTGWVDQGLSFDLAVHLGSLVAVVAYFRHEIIRVVRDWSASLVTRRQTEHSRIGWAVLWGTVPVGIAGLVFKDLIETTMRTPDTGAIVIACSMIGFGLLLGLADWRFRGEREERDMRWSDVLVIGIAQALALIPGTSRSGITMTAALFMGFSRESAARFSFLLSIPVIVLATGLQLLDLRDPSVAVDWRALWLGTVVAGVSAYACIHFFLAFITRLGMQPFVAYRLILGAILLWVFL